MTIEHTAEHSRETMTRPLRVLALADHLGHPGGRVHGATTYYATIFPRLARAGVELTACFMGPPHPAAELLIAEGVQPVFLDRGRWDPRALADVMRLIDEREVEILHLAAFKSHILGRIAAALKGRKSIVHLHDTVPLSLPVRVAQRPLARFTDLALAVSDPVGVFGVEEYGLPADRVRTLHNAIDLSAPRPDRTEARPRLLAEWGLPPESRLIGIIGRLAPMKGHAYAIRALPEIVEKCPGVRLVIVGDGVEADGLTALARELGVDSSIVFTGQRSDVPAVLAALDVVAMPSVFGEGLPYVAIEAIAAGRAIVAFPTAGIPEVVPHDEAGLLVAAEDVDGLAGALVRVLTDDHLRARLERGALHHSRRFGLERHVDRLLAIYESLRQAG